MRNICEIILNLGQQFRRFVNDFSNLATAAILFGGVELFWQRVVCGKFV